MSYTEITPKEAFEKIREGYVYLDVRTEEEFEEGHAKGATNIPIIIIEESGRVQNPNFVAQVKEKFPPSTRLVVGCKTGGRSAKACEILFGEGYSVLCNIDGGFCGNPNQAGWHDEGLPCSCC